LSLLEQDKMDAEKSIANKNRAIIENPFAEVFPYCSGNRL
jgi:hypothetical protein